MSDENASRNLEESAEKADPRIATENAYHLALGRFVSVFASVETTMHFVLRHYTRTSLGVGRAVFSGARSDVIRGYLRRLSDIGAIPAAQWEKLSPVLDQLRIISDRRNTLLHYGAEGIAESKGLVSNALMALTQDRVTTFPISDEILDRMTFDCRKIVVHLVFEHSGIAIPPQSQRVIGMTERTLQTSWRYISPQPAPSR